MGCLLGRTLVLGQEPIKKTQQNQFCNIDLYGSTREYSLHSLTYLLGPIFAAGRQIYSHRVLYIFCIFPLRFAHAQQVLVISEDVKTIGSPRTFLPKCICRARREYPRSYD